MPKPPTTNRGYFQFTEGEQPSETDLNEKLVQKVDTDVQGAFDTVGTVETNLATLKTRVDAHSDGAGNLTGAPPEFTAFSGTPIYIGPHQFAVAGNFTNEFLVNRALQATIVGSTPVSDVKAAAYDGGTNRTTVTLYDDILDATATAVALGFITHSLPRIAITDLDFDVTTQAEMDAHKVSDDHGAQYVRKPANGAPEVVANDIRIQKNSGTDGPKLDVEDLHSANTTYRIGRVLQIDQVLRLQLFRPSDNTSWVALDIDGLNAVISIRKPVDFGSNAVTNLPAPINNNDPARKIDVPVTDSTTPTTTSATVAAAAGSNAHFPHRDHQHALIAPSLPGAVGLVGSTLTATTFNFNANVISMRNPSTQAIIAVPGTSITNDITVAGSAANGRDQSGAFSVSSFIHFYAICKVDGSALATLSSASATSPTLPATYTNFAYLCSARMDGSGNMFTARVAGDALYYDNMQNVLGSGTATTEAQVDCSAVVPANARDVFFHALLAVAGVGSGQTYTASIRTVTGGGNAFQLFAQRATGFFFNAESMIFIAQVAQKIFYVLSNNTGLTGLTLDVCGYRMPNGSS